MYSDFSVKVKKNKDKRHTEQNNYLSIGKKR